jgi:hypothetical protein
MNQPVEAEIYRNGTIISEDREKKFALVDIEGITHLASKDPELSVKRGATVVVVISNAKEPRIL